MTLRVYLTGRLTVEAAERQLDQGDFPARQECLAFAYLTLERQHGVAREALAAILWPKRLPGAWETSLNAVISKLRAVLGKIGLKRSEVLSSEYGCYQLHLPIGAWVDIEAAIDGLHEAEGLLRVGKRGEAYGPAQVAYHISRRPFLPGAEGPWLDQQRERLRTIYVRSLEGLAEIYIWNNEPSIAVELAKEAVTCEPFRETAYQLLMRAHTAAGNRAEALWVYESCRKLLADELGVIPSVETRAVYKGVLRPE